MQANSRACDAGGVAAAEVTLEEVLAITSGNADAAVTHLHYQPCCFLLSNSLDGAPERRVFDRVGNQIAKCVKKQFGITVNARRQRRIIFADDHAASRIAMHLTCIAQQHTGIEFSWMEHRLPIQHARCAEQTVHDIRDPLHCTAYACPSLCNVFAIEPLAHLNEPLRMSVDDRERSSEFMGSHGDEIALLSRQPAFVLEPLLQRCGLFDQSTLAIHQS